MSGINLFNSFKVDQNAEMVGVPVNFGKNSAGNPIRLYLRRAGGSNTEFTKRYQELTEPYRILINNGRTDAVQDELNQVMRRLYAETVVANWEGVLDSDDTTELPYSVDTCIRIFEASPEVFSIVLDVSGKAAVYREQGREGSAKN